jgi:diguanylate cyclase (GGDEF)-like protein
MGDVKRSTMAYLALLMSLTIACLGVALRISGTSAQRDVLLAVLVAGCMALAVAVPIHVGPQQKLTLYGSVIFAAVMLLQPALAIVSVGLGTVAGQLTRRVSWDELLFNGLLTMLQAAAGSFALWWTDWNLDTLAVGEVSIIPVVLFTIVVMEAVNTVVLAGMITLESRASLWSTMRAVAANDPIALASPYALGLLAAVAIHARLWTLPLLLFLSVEVHRSSKRYAQVREQAATMEHRALHDPLTNLPNRALFVDRVEQALARVTRHQQRVAVLFVDLDRFKAVNDTLGHPAGDQLLIAVAQRVSQDIRELDTLARFGGDEFTLLAEDIDDARDAEDVARRLLDSLHAPFVIDGHQIAMSASIGIALSSPGATMVDELIKHADIALYRAKSRGGSAIAFYSPSDNAYSLARMTLEADLQRAVKHGEMQLLFQPQVDFRTSRVTTVEALVRWEHPERGLLLPSEFLALAEQSGLIVSLGRWILNEACQQARRWHEQWGEGAPTVSINLSVRQIHETDILDDVARALANATLPPNALALEVTEGTLLNGTSDTFVTLQRLKDLGVRLAIDDFGTGYAGLSYLKLIPADDIKIDQSFVRGIGHDVGDRAVVEAVLTLARSLSMRVVAEGVETRQQVEQLQAIGCHAGQGYYFSPPVSADELALVIHDGYPNAFAHR